MIHLFGEVGIQYSYNYFAADPYLRGDEPSYASSRSLGNKDKFHTPGERAVKFSSIAYMQEKIQRIIKVYFL